MTVATASHSIPSHLQTRCISINSISHSPSALDKQLNNIIAASLNPDIIIGDVTAAEIKCNDPLLSKKTKEAIRLARKRAKDEQNRAKKKAARAGRKGEDLIRIGEQTRVKTLEINLAKLLPPEVQSPVIAAKAADLAKQKEKGAQVSEQLKPKKTTTPSTTPSTATAPTTTKTSTKLMNGSDEQSPPASTPDSTLTSTTVNTKILPAVVHHTSAKQTPRTLPTARIRPAVEHHHRLGPSHRAMTKPVEFVAGSEPVSIPIQILCDALLEAKVKQVRDGPPVFVASTYEAAEQAMELFIEYYKEVNRSKGKDKNGKEVSDGAPGPVGFDTETSTSLIPRSGQDTSLVQIATRDICLMFQVYRIATDPRSPQRFPPRLKAFLEDPNQIKAGVGATMDGEHLKRFYGVNCAGIVSLEAMSAERKLAPVSLQELDAMFGLPGREVVKTKAVIKCNWDKKQLDPRWIWYAAKDAFAGAIIYENMMANNVRKDYVPYNEQFPLSEKEENDEIFLLLARSLGKGKSAPLFVVQTITTNHYPRFRKLYHVEERKEQAMKRIQMLLDEGRLRLADDSKKTTSVSELGSNDIIIIKGQSISSMITTPEGVEVLKPYFNNPPLDSSAITGSQTMLIDNIISKDGLSSSEAFGAVAALDLDLMDLKLFLKGERLWDRERRPGSLVNTYIHLRNMAKKAEDLVDEIREVESADTKSTFNGSNDNNNNNNNSNNNDNRPDPIVTTETKEQLLSEPETITPQRSSEKGFTEEAAIVEASVAKEGEQEEEEGGRGGAKEKRAFLTESKMVDRKMNSFLADFIRRLLERGILHWARDGIVAISPELEKKLLDAVPSPPPQALENVDLNSNPNSTLDGEDQDQDQNVISEPGLFNSRNTEVELKTEIVADQPKTESS
ncbi:hypothetical protein BX616_008593 [Lobosporangium transversale]|nr:hypothetical protein BX616_008593 [Lobosporangium transversale]